jgi:hypothetical protein
MQSHRLLQFCVSDQEACVRTLLQGSHVLTSPDSLDDVETTIAEPQCNHQILPKD